MRWYATLILASMGTVAAAPQPSAVLLGKVTDRDGNPVPGVEVAQFWLAGSGGRTGFRAYGASKTDAKGAFEIRVNQMHFPSTLFAIESQGHSGAIMTVPDVGVSAQLTLQLMPLHQVHYRFQSPDLTDLSHTRITLQPESGPMFSQIAGPLAGTISLPPGAYTLRIAAPGGAQSEIHFNVSEADLELDPVRLPANIDQYYGRIPPPIVGLQQVNGSSFVAEKLRGKWVLLYFWGYWCAPCVNEGLPKLKRFYTAHQGDRRVFEILAIHENGVAGTLSTDELRQKLDALAKDKWSGEVLPFPVLFDRTGEVIRSWGITAYPTVALLNPEGVLIRGDVETLERAVDGR